DGDAKLDACVVEFRRGDCTNDGRVNISDAICVFNHVRDTATRVECEKSADVDDSGQITATDGILLLRLLFVTGPEPDRGFHCGSDLTGDNLKCAGTHECVSG